MSSCQIDLLLVNTLLKATFNTDNTFIQGSVK